MPLVWWCQRSGHPDAGRVSGSDCSSGCAKGSPQRGHRHFFYGGNRHVVETLVLRLQRGFPGLVVAGYRSPPFRPLTQEEDAADVRAINETRSDFVWVGLETPKQDKWMAQHGGKIYAVALLGLYAGRLLYWKGVHIAIQAFAKFLTKIPNARFTIAGSGPEEATLKADALAWNIRDSVDFIPCEGISAKTLAKNDPVLRSQGAPSHGGIARF